MMARVRHVIVRACACAMLLGLAGCAHLDTVKPWQKGKLARTDMRFGADRLEGMFAEHVYSSKEAASGGTGEAGGGCGCY